jgi:uncharacterized protein YdeI (YjbR/CyaY-like superfamily)
MADTPEIICPASPQEWRAWLQAHHASRRGVWLVYHKKHTGTPSLTWSQAVDEALCFGWIDSLARPLDEARYQQYFSPRKPRSGWSKVNKDKVARLQAAGLLAEAGLASIAAAQQNGAWELLDDAEALRLPPDLAQALGQYPRATAYFAGLSRTDQRNILQWLALARRPETRQRRMAEVAALAGQQQKPPQFGGPKKA